MEGVGAPNRARGKTRGESGAGQARLRVRERGGRVEHRARAWRQHRARLAQWLAVEVKCGLVGGCGVGAGVQAASRVVGMLAFAGCNRGDWRSWAVIRVFRVRAGRGATSQQSRSMVAVRTSPGSHWPPRRARLRRTRAGRGSGPGASMSPHQLI